MKRVLRAHLVEPLMVEFFQVILILRFYDYSRDKCFLHFYFLYSETWAFILNTRWIFQKKRAMTTSWYGQKISYILWSEKIHFLFQMEVNNYLIFIMSICLGLQSIHLVAPDLHKNSYMNFFHIFSCSILIGILGRPIFIFVMFTKMEVIISRSVSAYVYYHVIVRMFTNLILVWGYFFTCV